MWPEISLTLAGAQRRPRRASRGGAAGLSLAIGAGGEVRGVAAQEVGGVDDRPARCRTCASGRRRTACRRGRRRGGRPRRQRRQLGAHLERADAGEAERELVGVLVGDAGVVHVALRGDDQAGAVAREQRAEAGLPRGAGLEADAVAQEAVEVVGQDDVDLAAAVGDGFEEQDVGAAGGAGVAEADVQRRDAAADRLGDERAPAAAGNRGTARPGRSTMWPENTTTRGIGSQRSSSAGSASKWRSSSAALRRVEPTLPYWSPAAARGAAVPRLGGGEVAPDERGLAERGQFPVRVVVGRALQPAQALGLDLAASSSAGSLRPRQAASVAALMPVQ